MKCYTQCRHLNCKLHKRKLQLVKLVKSVKIRARDNWLSKKAWDRENKSELNVPLSQIRFVPNITIHGWSTCSNFRERRNNQLTKEWGGTLLVTVPLFPLTMLLPPTTPPKPMDVWAPSTPLSRLTPRQTSSGESGTGPELSMESR